MKMQKLDRPFEVKAIADNGTFSGHASVFGELDSYRDIVMPGAFKLSLENDFAAKGRSVPMLWQHNAATPIGIYTTIKEDDIGLFVEGEVNMEVQQGREAHSLMKQGALSGLSIGYQTVNSEWDEKQITRKLLQVDLWEVSPVTFPAGDAARINSVKSLDGIATLSEVEDYLRDVCSLSKKEAATLISRIKATATQGDPAAAQAHDVKAALNIIRSL